MKKLKPKLLRIMEAQGMNVNRLARMSGLPQSSLYEMLNGERRPTFEAIAATAKILGVSLDYLADDDAADPPAPLTEAQKWAVDFIGDKDMSRKDVVNRLTHDPSVNEYAPLRPPAGGRKARS